jgi:hypothetical protein
MKQSTKRLLSAVGSIVLLGVALMAFVNYVRPAYDAVGQVRGEIASRQALLDREQSVVKKVQDLKSFYDTNTDLRDAIGLTLPLAPDAAGALQQLTGLIATNNLTPLGFSVSAPATPVVAARSSTATASSTLVRPIGTLTVQVRANGTYEDFKRFLGNLETNIRLMDIKNLAVSEAGKPTLDLYVFDLTVDAYYQQ